VRHCLEKKPAERFHSARDLAFAIESLSGSAISSGQTTTIEAASASTVQPLKFSRLLGNARVAWIIAAVCVAGLLAALAVFYFSRPTSDSPSAQLYFVPPPELSFNEVAADIVVISPDGQKFAFSAVSADGKWMLYVRDLDSSEAKVLPGSENAIEPFWSPDSRSIAFGSNGKLKRSDLSGGNAQVLCDAARLVGGTWNKDGVIIFTPDYRKTVVQVSAQGGEPKPVAMKSEENSVDRHRYPYFLPDGRHFLVYTELQGVWAGSLDSPEIKQILPDNSPAVYAPQGYLIFIRNDALVAQAFDATKLTLSGEAIPLITGQKNVLGVRRFSVSDNGILIWQGTWLREYQLVWFDREGRQTGTVDAPMKVSLGQDPHLSPDGKRLVVKRDSNLWVIDLEKGTPLRITSTFSQIPVWSPDGSRIAYSGGNGGMTLKAANGLGDEESLLPGPNFPAAWSPDGRFIVYLNRGVKTRRDIWVLPTFGDKKEYLLLNSAFDEQSPALSPNGRWLAYSSDETGAFEIYVQSFSADGKLGADKKRISTTGGSYPVWRRDDSELFFVAADGQMMSSAVRIDGTEFEFGTPKALFKTRMMALINFHEVDVSPDGQRFLVGTLIGESKAPPPTVIMNWMAKLMK
jgi:Tol biopolymer transport system component